MLDENPTRDSVLNDIRSKLPSKLPDRVEILVDSNLDPLIPDDISLYAASTVTPGADEGLLDLLLVTQEGELHGVTILPDQIDATIYSVSDIFSLRLQVSQTGGTLYLGVRGQGVRSWIFEKKGGEQVVQELYKLRDFFRG